jgi:Mg2+ and Co2+ transporter CorA
MISRYTHGNLMWIDLESPTREELLHLSEEHGLPKPVEEELFSKNNGSKIELYEQFIYLTLQFPQQLGFIIGKKFLVTVHHESVNAIQEFVGLFENAELLDYHKKISDTGIMFMELMKKLYDNSSKELNEITQRIPAVENNLFAHRENGMVKAISQTTSKVLAFKQTLQPQADVLNAYKVASAQLFGEMGTYYASLIISDFNKVYGEAAALLKNILVAIIIATILIVISLFIWH